MCTCVVLRTLLGILLMTFMLSTAYIEEGGHTFIGSTHIYDVSDTLSNEPVAKLNAHACLISKPSGQYLPWVEKHLLAVPEAHTIQFTPPPEAELSFVS